MADSEIGGDGGFARVGEGVKMGSCYSRSIFMFIRVSRAGFRSP